MFWTISINGDKEYVHFDRSVGKDLFYNSVFLIELFVYYLPNGSLHEIFKKIMKSSRYFLSFVVYQNAFKWIFSKFDSQSYHIFGVK